MTSAEPATRPPHHLGGNAHAMRLDYVALKRLLWVKQSGSNAIERMTANGAFPGCGRDHSWSAGSEAEGRKRKYVSPRQVGILAHAPSSIQLACRSLVDALAA